MKTIVKPSRFNGNIKANPSKSVMQRVIAVAGLSKDKTIISNRDISKDAYASIEVIKAIGAKVEIKGDKIEIIPGNRLKNNVWNVGESGLSARMFAPIAGLFEEDITITGEGSLMVRPMNIVVEALEQMGLKVEHNDYFLPITIKGKINNYNLKLDLSSGSQLLTGMLIALSRVGNDVKIEVENLKSKPYIDLTRCVLVSFGTRVENTDYKLFTIKANQKLSRPEFDIEGDWSGAAFHLVGAAISGKITLTGLRHNSKQSDRAILDVLRDVGAKVEASKTKIFVEQDKLNPFVFDASDAPDLFPPLAALAVFCNGVSKIKGVSRLKHKESDRYTTIKNEFAKSGINVEQEGDYMLIHGGIPKGGNVSSNNDHRIAMALAIVGLKAKSNITITNSEAISKSYPDFFTDYEKLGGEVILE